MGEARYEDSGLMEQVRQTLTNHNIENFGALLSEDVTWGEPNDPRACRNRDDVMATFSRLLSSGVDGHITELATGSTGILCGLHVQKSGGEPLLEKSSHLFHVYLVRDGQICEIQRYDDRESACEAAGINA